MSPDIVAIKRLIITALVSDDELFQRLVLKGGNALSLAYQQTARASFDIDFSMADAFETERLPEIEQRIRALLERTFSPIGMIAFDVALEQKPENISRDLQDFWGGYLLEFKLIERERYEELGGEIEKIRKAAVPSRPGGKARFEIDISRYEYCEGKAATEIDDFTVFVYTPAMIVCEKIRALCQQTRIYAETVFKHQAPRARDVFDIHRTIKKFKIDLCSSQNLELLQQMFKAKRVPIDLITKLNEEREFHRQDWLSVRDTVDTSIRLQPFEFYFDHLNKECNLVAQALGLRPRGT
jgi:predicted nucleotidyltransferase component of viral defense system